MKTWAKVLSVMLAGIVLIFVAGWLWLFTSDSGKKLLGFGGDITKLGKSAKSSQQLEKKFPFKTPEDGIVPEERLKVYIAVCTQMKPKAEPFNKWVREHEGQQNGNFWDATEVVKLLSDILVTMNEALTAHGMNPREFSWIQAQMRAAAREGGGAAATEVEKEMLDTLKEQAAKPGLAPEEKKALLDKVAGFERKMAAAGQSPTSPNAALYAKYADQLKACDLGEFGGEVAGGQGRHGGTHAGVHVDTGEKPPAEAE